MVSDKVSQKCAECAHSATKRQTRDAECRRLGEHGQELAACFYANLA